MIVQPDFLDHWKTRLLVDITSDPTAPLVVIRLWGFCQTSRRSYFPDLTPGQLASICRWGERKPACHVALLKAKFIEKLSPKGFVVHQWNEYNSKLLANWENGKKGGRPAKQEITNENGQSEKPMGSAGLTHREPIGPDRTGPEKMDRTGPEKMDRTGSDGPEKKETAGSGSASLFSKSGSGSGPALVQELAESLARGTTAGCCEPTLEQVKSRMALQCKGGSDYAEKWFAAMRKRGWKDNKGQPVWNWEPLADAWANACARRDLGVVGRAPGKKVR